MHQAAAFLRADLGRGVVVGVSTLEALTVVAACLRGVAKTAVG